MKRVGLWRTEFEQFAFMACCLWSSTSTLL